MHTVSHKYIQTHAYDKYLHAYACVQARDGPVFLAEVQVSREDGSARRTALSTNEEKPSNHWQGRFEGTSMYVCMYV